MHPSQEKAGKPYGTHSPYPHIPVCAFVNWPMDMKEKNPAEVLPLCYRDSHCDFFLWRNRWQDGKDTVISVLLNRTHGYMSAKVDKQICLNTQGEHLKWGSTDEGEIKHWWMSEKGEASSLTMAKGTCLAVDFTGASGADVMLATTGKAEGQTVKVGKKKVTFHFPTTETPPEVTTEKDAAIIGKQKVTFEDGNLVLAVTKR
jgi:hypothetical protein